MITAHECSVNYQRYSFTKFSQRWIFMIITITTSFMEWSILFVTDSYPVHSGILNKAFKEVPVSTIIHRFIMLNLSFAGEVFKSWIGHFRVPLGLCFKTRVGAQPLIWKSFFIFMQIKLIFTRKVVHLASFWKWGFLELASGLFGPPCKGLQDIFRFWIPCRRFRIPSTSFQSLSVELGFWIAIFSGIPVSYTAVFRIPKPSIPYSTFKICVCERQTFLLARRLWGTFREKERLRLSDRNSILMT